ncbi:MAG: hypothetical protein WA192_08685 [Candidatus Acidiferrales bacterium]
MKLLKFAQDAVSKVNRSIGDKRPAGREMVVGDYVVHTMSGIRGTLEGVETAGGKRLLTIRTANGQVLSKLARQEFKLCSEVPLVPNGASAAASAAAPAIAPAAQAAATAEPAAATATAVAEAPAPESTVDLKIDCSEGFSSASILDEV